ncbi:MAG: TonB-dependent receptor plug domain-containing protein [Alphaproteobacteria bacterium]|nr:TonB-dependent receptor plug domain-containing protein [Alphaproteobacteria bacterium]
MSASFRKTLMISAGAFVALAGVAAAQDATESDEIVVTAQKREQQLQDVPLSVQAIAGADLENSGASELNDLVRMVPGAVGVSRTAPGFETISIRGISSGTTGDATVGYYIDDVAFGVPNLQLAPPSRLFDLQRVEVLRGPQGTLWGQGAMGGTIRMVTASPNPSGFEARVQGEASDTSGGESGHALDGALNIPVSTSAALRLTGGFERVAGYAESAEFPGETDLNGIESWNARAKFGVDLSPSARLELGVWRIENEMDGRNTFSTVDPPEINGTGGNLGFIDTNLDLYSAVLNIDLGGVSFVSSTAYLDHELDFDQTFLTVLRNDSTFATESFTQELRLVSDTESPFSWIVGAYFNNSTITSDICLDFLGPCTTAGSIRINTLSQIDTTAWAVFGEASYALLDGRLIALVGARYFEDDRSRSGIDRNSLVETGGGTVFETFNPRFNLSYHVNDDVMIYFNTAKGFRSGAFQTQSQVDAATAAGIPTSLNISPDSVWSYEVGLKGRFFNNALVVDAALYRLDWTDIQLQFTVFGVAALANGGDAHSEGIDLGLTWNTPIEGLSFQLVGNTNDAVFDAVNPAISAAGVLDPGARIPNVPQTSAMVGVDYERPFIGETDVFFNIAHFARAEQLDATGLVSDDMEQWDARVGVAGDSWRVTLFGENITDETSALVRGTLGVQPQYPRRIGLRLSADF